MTHMGSPRVKIVKQPPKQHMGGFEIHSLMSPKKNSDVRAKVMSGLKSKKSSQKTNSKTLTKVKSARKLLGGKSPEKSLYRSRFDRK